MRQSFSRRAWLLGLFSGLAGLRRAPTATPAVSRAERTTPACPAGGTWGFYPSTSPGGPVTTYVYDGGSRLVSLRHGSEVTTYDALGRPLQPGA